MKTKIIVRSFCLCAALLGSCLSPAWAANVIKLDTATMNGAADWSVAPGATDIGEFDSTVSVANLAAMTLGGAVSLGGLQFDNNMNGPLTVTDGNTLTLDASGIDMSAANQNATLGCPIVLGADQTWNVTDGLTLTISGSPGVSTATSLTKTGNGVLNFNSTVNGTYTGNVSVNGGVLQINSGNANNNSAVGTGIITNNGATLRFATGRIVGNVLVFNGNCIVDAAGVGTAVDGAWQGTGTVLITNLNASGLTFTAGGNGNGGGNMNNFTGSIIIVSSNGFSAGNFRFNNGGPNNNLGNAAMTLDLGIGSVHFTEKNNSQTTSFGALFGGPNTQLAQQENYVIGGLSLTNDTFFGTSTGAASTFTKNGTGQFTWNNTNANTYTGTTTVNSGILQIGDGVTVGAGSLGSGAIVIAGGTLVYNKPADFAVTNAISGSGGTLVKTNTDTMTYYGTDTASSPTVISQGTLALGVASVMSSPVSVASGATFDVSQNSAFTLNQALSGSGIVNGLLTAVDGSINPGNPGTAGTLTINGGLTESGNVNNQFVLSQVGGTNDFLTVNGNLTVSGLNTITLGEFGGGVVSPGVYPLISYTGTLTGGTNNFVVAAIGFNGTVTNITSVTPNEIAVIVTTATRPVLNLTWVGDAVNNWDLTTAHDWVNGGTNYAFQSGDSAFFTDSGSANPPVKLQGSVFPASLVVSNTTKNYIFTGGGSVSGPTGLTKTNGGKLTLLNTNSYTGPTVIGGGVLELETGATSGSPGPIGAASSDPSNLVFYGSTFRYSGMDASNGMDHGLTIVGGMTVDVTNAATAFTEYGVVAGSGGLTKVGQGALVLQNVNTYVGGTVISNGMLALGNNNANWNGGAGSGVGLTNGPVTFMGTNGTLQLYGWLLSAEDAIAADTFNNFHNPLVVPAGQVGTLQLPGRGNPGTGARAGLNSSLTGGGTLNLVANFVRYPLSGDWSGFTGQINVTGAGFPNANANTVSAVTANVDEFQINNTNGYANAAIYLDGLASASLDNSPASKLVMCQTVASGATINIGELGGDYAATLGTGTGSSGNTTWSVGWKNTTNTFAGVIANDSQTASGTGGGVTSITKVGTGEWLLAGLNTYSGSTTVSNGVLALIVNSITANDASIANSANIFINTNAVLDVTGLSSPTLTLNAGQALGGGGTLNGAVTANSGANINPGGASATGVLTINNGLTESVGVNNNFELSTVGNSDVIHVQGNLDVFGGIQNINLSGVGTNTIAAGTYPLFTYTGSLIGGTNNFVVNVGATAYTTKLAIIATTPPEIAVIVGALARQPVNLVWSGDNGADNWDTTGMDWLAGANHYSFLSGDSVTFNDAGAANTTVTLQAALYPASLVVSNSTLASYTFTGSGSIAGSIGLLKTNSGTLTILAANTYTGPTVIGGGTLSISSVANGGLASPLGAASGNSTNLLFAGGTLAYTGPSAGTDRGATLNGSGGTFDVIAGASLTNNGVIAGSGALTLTDTGTLILAVANTYTGGTMVNNGTLVLSNATAAGTGTINLGGGTLSINGLTIANAVNATGNATIANGSSAATFSGNFTGAGTLNLNEPTNGTITFSTAGQMSGFTGTLKASDLVTNAYVRFSACTGSTAATFDLGNGSAIMHTRNGNPVNLGALLGGVNTTLEGARTATGANTPYSIGGNNASTTFNGTIMDGTVAGASVSITKVGTGTLTLTGTNTYTGPTTVSNGVLLVNGSITNSATNDGPVTVSGGTLGGLGTLGGAVTVQSGGTLAPGAGTNVAGTVLTLNSNLTLQAGSTTIMQVSHSANDQVTSAGTITYGGTLMIATNAGDATPYHVGDKFTLFNLNGGTYNAGSGFATIQPPPGPGLGWSGTNMTIDGSIQVVTSATPPAPVAGFSGTPTTLFVTQAVAFTDASTGSITNWVWSYGDGHSVTNTTSANVTNMYALAGSYTVSLIVNGAGGSSTNTKANYVVVKPKTAIVGVTLAGGKLVFSGANGPAGQPYRILTATNVALPLAGWTPVWTNVFAADGSYSYTNTLGTNAAGFFLLVSP
jgi:autotransporter-associated beta strand protein